MSAVPLSRIHRRPSLAIARVRRTPRRLSALTAGPVHMVVLLVLLGFALLTVGVMQLVARFAAPGRAMMRAAMASARVGPGVVLAAATVPLVPALVQHHRALVAKRAEEERKKREAAARAARPPAAGECAIA